MLYFVLNKVALILLTRIEFLINLWVICVFNTHVYKCTLYLYVCMRHLLHISVNFSSIYIFANKYKSYLLKLRRQQFHLEVLQIIMTISRVIIILVVAVAISCTLATPVKRSKVKFARQIELTTPSSVVEQSTGYPDAGFRPKIPFDLPNEKPKTITESIELVTIKQTESTMEDSDEILPTTVKPEVEDRTPANTYGPPLSVGENDIETVAEIVPVPAEDFQPPSEEPIQDFSSTIDVTHNSDSDVIADIPAVEQTSEVEDIDVIVNQLPANRYGTPEIKSNEPKVDVEQVDQEIDIEQRPKISEDVEVDVEVSEDEPEEEDNFEFEKNEGSAESEIHEPANTYGAPKTELVEENEIESELEEVEQQLEILSRLTRMKNGRLVILPIDKNLYLGRLVSSQPKRGQSKNDRLLKL